MPDPSANPANMVEAQREAVRRARERLRGADLAQAAARGGLTLNAEGAVECTLFGRPLRVMPGSLAVAAPDGGAIHVMDEMLVLRYLEAERAVQPLGLPITFRDLPGGNFYLAPILNRTTHLVLKVYQNDIEGLRRAVERLPHEGLEIGDLSARIPALGRLDLTLIYRLGDEEFPPTLDLTFDKIIASVYHIDEVAALAQRLCLLLSKR